MTKTDTVYTGDDSVEMRRADEIVTTLRRDYAVTLDEDWQSGIWEPAELETVFKAVRDLARVMGGAQEFRDNLGGVKIMRKALRGVGEAYAHNVSLNSNASGGFMDDWQKEWTVVHELAHAWDATNRWRLSKDLVAYTGGHSLTQLQILGWVIREGVYDYVGTPPKGSDANFTCREDFAESVTTFVYPQGAQRFIKTYYAKRPEFQYSDYYALPRALFVARLMRRDIAEFHMPGEIGA